jgi:hypothetical protein
MPTIDNAPQLLLVPKEAIRFIDQQLDRLVCAATESGPDSASGEPVLFPDVEPWHEPVDGGALLTDLAATCRRYAVLPKFADVAIALWVVFSHAIDSVNIAPILALTSAGKAMREKHGVGAARAAGAAVLAVQRRGPRLDRTEQGRRGDIRGDGGLDDVLLAAGGASFPSPPRHGAIANRMEG